MIRTTRRGVPHRRRERFFDEALHVTVRVRRGLPSLRGRRACARILDALHAFRGRFDCRVVEFAILSNHLHLIVEPVHERELARAMKGLLVRIARGLNRLWRRAGSVFAERYHARIVRKVHELRRLVRYVLHNARRHGVDVPSDRPDACSSGPWFPSWLGRLGRTFSRAPCPVERPRTMALACAHRFQVGLAERPIPAPALPGRRRRRGRLPRLA